MSAGWWGVPIYTEAIEEYRSFFILERNADEIKNGGSYFLEACGEYIFVFDNKTDKLVNKLRV